MEERELKKRNSAILIMFFIFLIILVFVICYFKLFNVEDVGGACPSDNKSDSNDVVLEDVFWYDLNAIFYIEDLDNTLGKEKKTGFLKYKDDYVLNTNGDKINPLVMLIGENDGESYGKMFIFDNDRNIYTIELDDMVDGKEKLEVLKYNSSDIIDLSIVSNYSVPTIKDLKDYYFNNYQIKVKYSNSNEELFDGKNLLDGTVLDFD